MALFELRQATVADLPSLMRLINEGIAALGAQGSPQWQDGYGPSEEKIRDDILKQESYVLVSHGEIAASAALVSGIDPVYTAIQAGQWVGDGPYLSIHRVVVNPQFKGQRLSAKLLQALEAVAKNKGVFDLRIDTYQANTAMQRNITAAGYSFCGHIEFPIPNGERLAYQKLI
ncbi:GNAT family N-acetyltransferase [Enterococcus sp. DIV0876]|uniref:GNAT family N-acetyltransferase n=1 Tax=Enterococcus sp. DIV0876 TaxID=2774633 RepID=UPI003D2FFA87